MCSSVKRELLDKVKGLREDSQATDKRVEECLEAVAKCISGWRVAASGSSSSSREIHQFVARPMRVSRGQKDIGVIV